MLGSLTYEKEILHISTLGTPAPGGALGAPGKILVRGARSSLLRP